MFRLSLCFSCATVPYMLMPDNNRMLPDRNIRRVSAANTLPAMKEAGAAYSIGQEGRNRTL
ncbi:hypothetical protein DSM19430T_23210 [Desulfovibrio psychrotolerans]|uniref:Uncharacterized protein n=1 Tax=Desulfovibrio psychrotolerans TaxID=415242 RepID=A0A7J0BVA2_9BACT|nr:hypothetical protein DSM19430T_23210 [Desulfovibrio psychrotolerans]